MRLTTRTITNPALALLLSALAALTGTGCGAADPADVVEAVGTVRIPMPPMRGPVVGGVVQDLAGQSLPGVAVTSTTTGDQAITGPTGTFRVRYRRGEPVIITFIKSGYTPGIIELDDADGGPIEVDPVRLYRLPVDSGFYFFEDLSYRAMDSVLPERFVAVEPPLGAVYGTRRREVGVTEDPMPMLIGFRIPRSGLALYRLRPLEMRIEGPRNQIEPVDGWVPANAVAVGLTAIDEPDGLLRVVQLDAPLAPGRYALHWGALDGDRTIDQRVFVFEVVEPPATDNSAGESDEDQGEGESS